MSFLQKSLSDYLTLRRSLGFKLVREGMWLPHLVRSVERAGSTFLTTELALRWAMGPKNPPPQSWTNRLSMARKFAQYLHARDPRTEVPPGDLAPRKRTNLFEPWIYQETEIQALMEAARKHSSRPFKGDTYSTVIGLLAATGMRVGEAIALDRSDFDARQGLLQIRKTKFGKSRQLPLHPSVTQALSDYARRRDRTIPRPSSPAFFPSTTGSRLIHVNFHACFFKRVRSLGLGRTRAQPPRIHDLRHTFAVRTLTAWYRAGVNTESRLPSLSTYLGHVCPSSTYTYLRATPELLQQARRRLELAQARGGRS